MAGKRKKVEFVVTDAGCHECTSHAVGTSGYPCVWKNRRNQNLHRVLYEEKFGPLGDLVARHTCDNRKCIKLPGAHCSRNPSPEYGRHGS